MRIFVGGCNGSGKTTVLNSDSIEDLEVIHATKGFMKWLGIGDDYNKLRAMPDKERERKLIDFMNDLILSRNNFILDSHYLILVYGELKQVMANWISKFDVYVLVTAPTSILLERIESDSSRNRALFPNGISTKEKLEILDMYQDTVRMQSQNLANEHSKPYLEIVNDKTPLESLSVLKKFITEIS